MAKTETVFIWEKSLYCSVAGKGWRSFPLARLEDAVALIQEHIKEGTRINLVYDPDLLHTEYTECPTGPRNIVREAVAATHEAIGNMHTAWGFQTPVPIPGSNGNNSTFVSYETVPSLLLLRKSLEEIKRPIHRAHPLLSIATQAGASPGRTTIFIVVENEKQAFIYLHTATGVRACRKLYAGKRDDFYDVWAEISLVFGEYGITFEDGGQRPAVRVYQAHDTDIKTQCSYWDSLQQMAQVEAYNFSVLASMAGNLPGRHTSSLMEDMPRTVRLDMGFQIACGVFGVALLGLGIYAYFVLSEQSRQIDGLATEEKNYTAQKTLLVRNKTEMEKLQTLYAQDIFEAGGSRWKFLDAVVRITPREATLVGVTAGSPMREGGEEKHAFQVDGIFWNAGVDATDGRNAGNSTTLITPITMGLSKEIPGLLVTEDPGALRPATGDFTIKGKTPVPANETLAEKKK